jgi:hypothetical protein
MTKNGAQQSPAPPCVHRWMVTSADKAPPKRALPATCAHCGAVRTFHRSGLTPANAKRHVWKLLNENDSNASRSGSEHLAPPTARGYIPINAGYTTHRVPIDES